MTADELPFQFTDEAPEVRETLVVQIPPGLDRKRNVLAKYAVQLRFPRYFGWNWDAFEECLNDLSWLAGVTKVIVVHRDIPFAGSDEQREIYLSILRDRCAAEGMPFEVRFPRSARGKIKDI
jgi:hypothetical protein